MTKITYNVCVLTVTYGNRWAFLEQVLTRVLSFHQVAGVVVVDNHSDYDIGNQLRLLNDSRLTLLRQQENSGSAGGYKRGIEHVMAHPAYDFIWFLDDDNLPHEDALTHLTAAWNNIGLSFDKKALCCLRLDRKNQIQIARGSDPYQYYLVPNNFMGFNIFRVFINQYRKLSDRLTDKKKYSLKAAKLPYVPYGGLFIHKEMTGLIGYPDERFFVYVDDSDYTYRITKNGGEIWLIPESTITDVDTSQGIDYKARPWRSAVLDLWNFRTYYQVRNRMYFYSRNAVTNRFTFALNKWLYLTGQYIISVITKKQAVYKKLKDAIQDGIDGRFEKQ